MLVIDGGIVGGVGPKFRVEIRPDIIRWKVFRSGELLRSFGTPVRDSFVLPMHVLTVHVDIAVPGVVENVHVSVGVQR